MRRPILTRLLQEHFEPYEAHHADVFLDCILDDTARATNWQRLSAWANGGRPLQLEVWQNGGWKAVDKVWRLGHGRKRVDCEVAVAPSTWCVVLRKVGHTELPGLHAYLTDKVFGERPTWCHFDTSLIGMYDMGLVKPPRRSHRERKPSARYASYQEIQEKLERARMEWAV